MCITKTVREEGLGKLHEVVNRYFDRANIKAPAVRQNVYMKLRHRYLDLAKQSRHSEVPSDLSKVRSFYDGFLRVPELRAKLSRLQAKKHRKNLLPSDTDMTILGEACTLSLSQKVFFVTDDGDFLEFKNEIERELKVNIIELMDLRRFADCLLSK